MRYAEVVRDDELADARRMPTASALRKNRALGRNLGSTSVATMGELIAQRSNNLGDAVRRGGTRVAPKKMFVDRHGF